MSSPSAVAPADRLLRWVGHQRWLRYGLRERLLFLARDPSQPRDLSFETSFAGLRYRGNLSRLIDWMVYYFGGYELDELELVRDCVGASRGAIAFDVGANVGHHTLYFASFCAQVHAFEPYPVVGRLIDEKIAINGLSNVVVHPVGIGDEDIELDYFAPAGTNTGTGSFVGTHEVQNNRPAGRLRVVHGDRFVEGLGLPALDLVKIDVEGFELSVVRGLRGTFERYRPTIVMELSDEARAGFADAAAFLSLFPRDYTVARIEGLRHRWMLFGRRGCGLAPLAFDGRPAPGGYVNLLLQPVERVRHQHTRGQ